MFDEHIITYTRSILKNSDSLKTILGEGFEVYWGHARRNPEFNYINISCRVSNPDNDPVSRANLKVDIWVNNLDGTVITGAAATVRLLLHRKQLPGPYGATLYYKDRDYFLSDERLRQAALLFNIRGVDDHGLNIT